MTIKEALAYGTEILKSNGKIEFALLESEILLGHVLKKERVFLLLNSSFCVCDDDFRLFSSFIKRRSLGEPISYITEKKEFMSLDFYVCPGVLVPRPDTETLVEYIIDVFKNTDAKILDLCTGSGAICVSLAKYIKNASLWAVDISETCLSVAEKNAKANGVSDKITFLKADATKPLDICEKFDCIVSNPPYIKTEVLSDLMSDVKDFEPSLALDGGPDGLLFYRSIVKSAGKILKDGGVIAFEVGHDQSGDVEKILKEYGFCDIFAIKDLASIERVVTARYYI